MTYLQEYLEAALIEAKIDYRNAKTFDESDAILDVIEELERELAK